LPLFVFAAGLSCVVAAAAAAEKPEASTGKPSGTIRLSIPDLQTDKPVLDEAFRIAIGDLLGNVRRFRDGLLDEPAPCILAGLDYDTPWTRDAAINCANGASLIVPQAARNTLLSVLVREPEGTRIGGQYWDAIVWVTGAWHHYLYTGDRDLLRTAFDAAGRSLAYFERTEWNAKTGLFRGPGWSDGIAAYPDAFAKTGGSSAILDWPKHNPDKILKPGYGIPMEALSTNCLYYNAYRLAGEMARELGTTPDPAWADKAESLRRAIQRHLWLPEKGCFRYFVSPLCDCDHQEGLGHAYAILFGVADARQTESIFARLHVAPAGLPCQWPSFSRYDAPDGRAFARHSGTVWPQIQAFWAEAAARHGRRDVFAHELLNLAAHAVRDRQFVEIYHPITGLPYGGMQEAGSRGIVLWQATGRQTWAATGYLRMILLGLVGMRVDAAGLTFQPCLPQGVRSVRLGNVAYRGMTLDVTIEARDAVHAAASLDGKDVGSRVTISARDTGPKKIRITVPLR
jgi:glycogen debranching enzyme